MPGTPVDILFEDKVRRTNRYEEYYSDYRRYQLMQVDKTPVLFWPAVSSSTICWGSCTAMTIGSAMTCCWMRKNSIEKKLHTPVQEEWEDEDYETCDC